MRLLYLLTTSINLLALAISLWLGFYIVTRSPRRLASWLAALTGWLLAGFFLNNTLMLNHLDSVAIRWLSRTVVLTPALWFHLTALLTRPPHPTAQGTARTTGLGVGLAYLVGLAFIAFGSVAAGSLTSAVAGFPVFTSGRVAGSLYPSFLLFLGLMAGLSLGNLGRGWRQATGFALRQQYMALLRATGLAFLGALYLGLGILFGLDLPTLPGDVGLAAGIVLIGHAVATHNALLEGRTAGGDFIHALIAIGVLTALYLLGAIVLYYRGDISFQAQILVIIVAISSHALYDGLRRGLDRLFAQRRFALLRANSRNLVREVNDSGDLSQHLQRVLQSLSHALQIKECFFVLNGDEGGVVVASHKSLPVGSTLPAAALRAGETLAEHIPGWGEGTLLLPMSAGGDPVGALALGVRAQGHPYTDEDLDLLEDLADRVAGVFRVVRLQESNAQTLNRLMGDFQEKERNLQQEIRGLLAAQEQSAHRGAARAVSEDFIRQVEDGLRHLHDFPYLGEHPLAQLLSSSEMPDAARTHIARGKALSDLLVRAIEQLRPDGELPSRLAVPSREWYAFLILHDSYVLGELNRDIMARLYISEGTFNRTRRRAIRAVAKALCEMGQEAQPGAVS